ncbi:MAG: T9SS type A sorting domain-containing protein [Bacteroides sp.]|nr:T9SS type A sorting domain-containing protein [Bacteroides sp.]
MKKFLLSIAAVAACIGASAQATYNYFDAVDVDANGWLWFDSQAKIDKYVGFGNKYKIQLQSATFEDAEGQYAEPFGDPEAIGWNAAGELGGEGAKKGAIVLPGGSVTNGSDSPNGGGIMLQLPDCAEFDLFLSTSDSPICVGLSGAKGWVEAIDCAVIQTYMKMGIFLNMALSNDAQYEWNNIQNLSNGNTGLTLAAPAGDKVTGLVRNNIKRDLYVHGIKVVTYTETSGIADVIADGGLNLTFDGESVNASVDAAIEVFAVSGSRVAMGNGSSLSLSNLAPGAYIVKATADCGTATIKIVR